jgi:hypothetical protein
MAMADLESKLDAFECCMRQFDKAFEIVFSLITAEYEGQTSYNTLREMGGIVTELNNDHLTKLYNKLFEEAPTPDYKYQQIHPEDYFAFLTHLHTILKQQAIQANQADIALRATIGLQSVIGIWGGTNWHPAGKYV